MISALKLGERMNIFIKGLRYWKKFIPLQIVTMALSFIAIVCDLLLPLLSADIVNYVIKVFGQQSTDVNVEGLFAFLFTGKYGEIGSMELFWNVALVFLALVGVRLVLLYFKNVTFQASGLKMENDLRDLTYHKLMSLDAETLTKFNTGELLTTMNRDTIMIKEMYCRIVLNIFDSICVLAISIIILAGINVWLLLIPLTLSPLLAYSLIRFIKKNRQLFKEIRDCQSDINLTVQENISAVRLVRSFAGEEMEKKKFDRSNLRVKEAHIEQVNVSSKYHMIFNLIKQGAYVGTVCVMTYLILIGRVELSVGVGLLTAVSSYVMRIMNHITQINRTFMAMQMQLVSAGRLLDFLDTEPLVKEGETKLPFVERPHILFENVSITYGDHEVIKHIDLDIPFGKKVGIMGGTGSGKSAVLKGLSRIRDVSAGKITIDGHDIREYGLESLRNEFSYVFQDVFLFSHTIDANIGFYDPDCKDEEIYHASQESLSSRFVEKLPDGYQTVIGERGLGISGGQKQRISIARALLKNAPVLILDDASSALDMATEKKVLTNIKTHYPEKTLIIAAHRISSVEDCDEILYMQDGEIIERGTKEELIALGGRFAEIYQMQTADGQLDDSSYGKEEA